MIKEQLMNGKLIKIVWHTCIILTILTGGWPMFDNDYITVIWILSVIASIVLTNVVLAKASHVHDDLQLNCSIISAMCILFSIVFALVVLWGLLNDINDEFVTVSKCLVCVLSPIAIITENIALWKPKK